VTSPPGLTPEQIAKRAEAELLLGRFQSDQQVHQQEWLKVQSQVPRRLHHYTTIDGLAGITTSSSLWASDVRFMNDSSELSYAAKVVEDVIEEVLTGTASKSVLELLPSRAGLANSFEYGARPFIACFCEAEDLLSQWRGYGSGQAPVSLGLDLSHLSLSGRMPNRTFLRKVVYDVQAQRSAVKSVVETWLATIESLVESGNGPSHSDLLPYPGIWALQSALAEHHLCFKHPTFAEEQEWRLIKLVDVREEFRLLEDQRREEMMAALRVQMRQLGHEMPDYSTAWSQANAEGIDIKFRSSALGLIPYVELPLLDSAGVFNGRLPLWQVVQGPTMQPDLALESLGMYLESKGYGFHTEVKLSGIPLRS